MKTGNNHKKKLQDKKGMQTMISKKYKAEQLIGRKCRPTRNIINGAGDGITPDTICTIRAAHYGVEIQTEKCPHCGQYCRITRISREDLELIDE